MTSSAAADSSRPAAAAPDWAASSPDRFSRLLPRVAWPILLAALAVAIDASLARRGLLADGASFLLYQLRDPGSFHIQGVARAAVQGLQQLPTAIAVAAGWRDLFGVQVLHSVTLHLLPWLLVVACWPLLPRDRKAWFVFPLVHYVAGTQTGQMFAMAEGLLSAAYFWFVFFLLLFVRERPGTLLATVLAALPLVVAHEAMMFLGPLLAVAAARRARAAKTVAGRRVFAALAAWTIVAALLQLGFILFPFSENNRTSFFSSFVSLAWLRHNMPAQMSCIALVAMCVPAALVWARHGNADRVALIGATGLALACLALVGATLAWPQTIVPFGQFAARNNADFLSFLLGVVVLATLGGALPAALWARSSNLLVLAILAGGVLSWQVLATREWSRYVATVERLTRENPGLLPWPAAMALLPADEAADFDRMTWGWTMPALSVQLAPDGKIVGIIGERQLGARPPFDPNDPGTVPDAPFFDAAPYRAAMAAR